MLSSRNLDVNIVKMWINYFCSAKSYRVLSVGSLFKIFTIKSNVRYFLIFWFSIKLDIFKLDKSWMLILPSTDTKHNPIFFSHEDLEGRCGVDYRVCYADET